MQITFDPELPISARTDDIARAVRENQVVVVAGETGSGKTTQLPKICLQLGLRSIAHTQPRRIAARSVAERIAEELKVTLGEEVGYQVRFTRQARADSPLVLMTDGVLLAEIAHDRDLRRHDCIIIDEAHERSLNIDFLLGYLKQLLPRRPELKVVITSATIDTARFAAHFDDAPVIEVSGRTYPVELRYRPLQPDDPDETQQTAEPRDQVDGICAAVTELSAVGPGDILVFLSGEREIRDTAEALTALRLRDTEILPLYARLSAAEQHRVFSPHTGRRIVLATNVAETSLTVPGIRYVVDPGTARISRWSARTKVQRLPIEPISQASANQRAGRCGRVAAGVCIRLYSESDYGDRPEFTEPEILRTNLASVILQMAQAELGEISEFPFVEPPDSAQIADGVRLLLELGALSEQRRSRKAKQGGRSGSETGPSGPQLTRIGHQLARIPLDPRLARMLVEAARRDCLAEVIVIAAGLTINDPRERPAEHQQAADALHRRFWAPPPDPRADPDADPPTPDGSDFIAWLRLWNHLAEQRESLSGNAFRRMCRDEFLHFLRIREWQDLVTQLRQICRELKLERNGTPGTPDAIHIAILSGVLSQIGLADLKAEQKTQPRQGKRRRTGPREYLGTRGARFAINPGSALARTQPELVMAGELVETTRLWARTVAGIDAAWVEQVGSHLLTRQYSEPRWSARQGRVVASERVSLLGVPIIAGRTVGFGGIDPAAAREIFIRSALVEGDWRTRHHFFARNAETRSEAEELEERTRRRDLVVDDQAVFDFYDARIPADVVSGAHFDSWWRKKRHEDDGFLDLTLNDLVAGAGPDLSGFPDSWPVDGHELPVRYVFEPGHADDGVQVTLDLSQLNQVRPELFGWQVPGLRAELATALIRGLPKQIRTRFVPAPEFARRALAELDEHPTDSFTAALGAALRRLTGELVPADAWRPEAVDPHLRVTFVVTDRSRGGRELGRGKDLGQLQHRLAPQLSAKLTRAVRNPGSRRATEWSFGRLADEQRVGGGIGYPGLTDVGAAVDLVVHDNRAARDAAHPAGLRRLVLLNTPDPTRWVVAHLSNTDKLALGHSPYASVPELLADARLAVVGRLVQRARGAETVRDADAFTRLCDTVRADLADTMRAVVAEAAEVLRRTQSAKLAIASIDDPEVKADAADHLAGLVHPGFLSGTPEPWSGELARYVAAIGVRLANRERNPRRDDELLGTIWPLESEYADLRARQRGPIPPALREIGWQLEELRVGLFAQQLGTREPVSAKRVRRALESVRAELAGRPR
ncbi:ATP-dependent RNA helicase HrpA [Enemella dayhoffiae]|uniref:ATP-dependent RNA helicase HrpA n=1 Tax=Enemella dayhoffiae TaxID=2016507 RepID=A0A255H348_9ACTN|nr:ATP-dependent RNA helicase HrpA [Enemella dayhoffiae]OYO22027.1 ATP-dependent RNA helicase HrpA [Enemella dayhoffiae]